MKILKQLLVVIASAGVTGSAQAMDPAFHPDTPPLSVEQWIDSRGTPGASMSYSFMDIASFTIGTNGRAPIASTASRAPEGFSAGLAHATDPTLSLFAGPESAGSALGAAIPPNGAMIDTATELVPSGISARVPGIADGQPGGAAFGLTVAAVPEPAEWMLLLSSLVFVAFIARRKTSWATG